MNINVRNPLKARRGEAAQFIETALAFDQNKCLDWPFSLHRNGYPKVKEDGRTALAHRVVCERAHGQPPSEDAEAAHSCGNQVCVAPRHLGWKTRTENERDKVAHRTLCSIDTRTFEKVISMLGTMRQVDIAAAVGISQAHVSRIKRGEVTVEGRR